jgi:hypothetical protein
MDRSCARGRFIEGAVCLAPDALVARSRRAIVVVTCDESLVGVIRDGYTDGSSQADVSLSTESGPSGSFRGGVSGVGAADPPSLPRCDTNSRFAVFEKNLSDRCNHSLALQFVE